MTILRLCSDELKRRLPIDFKGLYIKIITKDGIREQEFADEKQVLPA
jgi:20S proteasome subunit beta 4